MAVTLITLHEWNCIDSEPSDVEVTFVAENIVYWLPITSGAKAYTRVFTTTPQGDDCDHFVNVAETPAQIARLIRAEQNYFEATLAEIGVTP